MYVFSVDSKSEEKDNVLKYCPHCGYKFNFNVDKLVYSTEVKVKRMKPQASILSYGIL